MGSEHDTDSLEEAPAVVDDLDGFAARKDVEPADDGAGKEVGKAVSKMRQRVWDQFRSGVNSSARTRSTSSSGKPSSGAGWLGGNTPTSSDFPLRAIRNVGPGAMPVT